MSVQWLEIPRPLRDTKPHLTMSLLTWRKDHPSMGYYWNQLMMYISKFYELTQASITDTIEFDTVLDLTSPDRENTLDPAKLLVVPPLPEFCVSVDLAYNRVIDLNPLNGHLQNIDISFNQIQTLVTLKLPYLRQLCLCNNDFQVIPHLLVASKCLTVLDISYNQVKDLPMLNSKNAKLIYDDNPIYMEHLQTLKVNEIDRNWCYGELLNRLQLNFANACPSDWKDCVSRKVHDSRFQHMMNIIEEQNHVIEGMQIKMEGLIAIQHTLFDKFRAIQAEREFIESSCSSSSSISSPAKFQIIQEEQEYKSSSSSNSVTRKRQQMMMSDDTSFYPASVVNEEFDF